MNTESDMRERDVHVGRRHHAQVRRRRAAPAVVGSQSTGIRSMRFIKKTQMKIVSDSGAMSLFWPLEGVAHGGVDEADDELDRRLQLARAARREAFRDAAEQEAEHERRAESRRPCESTLSAQKLPWHSGSTDPRRRRARQTCRFVR